MWESQVLLTDGQVVFLRVLRFSPTFDERSARYKWNILERAVKPKSKKKKKKKKKCQNLQISGKNKKIFQNVFCWQVFSFLSAIFMCSAKYTKWTAIKWGKFLFFFSVYELWHEKMCKQLMPRSACPMCNLDQELLCFPHLLESHLLFGALHRTSKFANFCHDLMQNCLL